MVRLGFSLFLAFSRVAFQRIHVLCISLPSSRQQTDFPASLKGQVHIVTGANAGIGFAVARQLARLGASTHLVCRNAQRGRDALESIQRETGNQDVHLHVVDVGDSTQVRAFACEWDQKIKLPINSLVYVSTCVLHKFPVVSPHSFQALFLTCFLV
jgi:hypothetical protein